MLIFCPSCSNALTISRTTSTPEHPLGINRLECRTCPYQFLLSHGWYERTPIKKRKEVEDIMGGEGAWSNVDQTEAQCPKEGCDGDKAFFYMLQTRSADEPMTRFYRCTKCHHKWNEN